MAAAALPVLGMSAGTASTIGTVLSAVSTVAGVVGQIQQSRAAESSARYNAALAEQNRRIALQQAKADERTQRRSALRRAGSARAAAGASGLTLEGSALDILEDNAVEEELSALNIRYQGQLRARGFGTEASLERSRAANASSGVGTALLTGAADIGSQFISVEEDNA